MPSHYLDPTTSRALHLLPSSEADRYFDYCLEPYRPRRPWKDKYRSENLLWHSLLIGNALDELREPLRAVQQSLGKDLTVWGVKWDGSRLWWEVYFYDPRKEDPNATITSIASVLSEWIRVVPRVAETIPYMMVSFDLDASVRARGSIDAVNLYLTGEKAHAGRSYRATGSGFELENTYRFIEPKRDIDEVLPLLRSSAFVDYSGRARLAEVLMPQLFACKKVCISKKRTCDAIYYSGINIEQLLWFFRRFSYPAALVDFVEKHQERFEHLYFDVGIDYRTDESGSICYPKTSYYGTL